MTDHPIDDTVPWVLRQPGVRLIEMGIDDQGKGYLVFAAKRGRVQEVTVHIGTSGPWTFGYVLRDTKTKTRRVYHGIFGDPERDTLDDIQGI